MSVKFRYKFQAIETGNASLTYVLRNDIGLIKLKHPIERFNKELLTWCSASFDNRRDDVMHAVGMGFTKEGHDGKSNKSQMVKPSDLATVLQEVELEERVFSAPFLETKSRLSIKLCLSFFCLKARLLKFGDS